jgi:hypothetical protein
MRALLFIVALGACTFDRPADVTFGEAAITITEGDGQTGVVDTELPTALKVNVTDADFLPIENFTVEFTVRDANGEVSEEAVRTDAQGNARTELKLGTRSGEQFVDVSGEGIEGNEPVFFAMTALADVPAQISAYAGSGESATVATQLLAPLVARVEDRFGNPSPAGVDVSFGVASGGGSLSVSVGTSGSDGTISTQLTLGTGAGPQTVRASASGLTEATFTVLGLAAAPVSVERVTAATSLVDALRPNALTVLARDVYGNPASGATIAFARTAGNGTVTAASVVTGADGRASGELVPATMLGANTVQATASLTGSPISFATTTRTIRAAVPITMTAKVSRSLAVADINLDGLPDLIAASTTPSGVFVYLSTTEVGGTTPSFTGTHVATTSTATSSTRLAVGDINGDGKPDIVMAGQASAEILPNSTAAGSMTPTFEASLFVANASTGQPHLADINGDQMLDLVVINAAVRTCLRTGATTFAACQTSLNTGFSQSSSIVDMNGDGSLDIASAGGGTVQIAFNTTPAGGAVSFATSSQPLGSYSYSGLGDLDNDGKPDWMMNSSSFVKAFRNDSAGTTATFAAATGDMSVLALREFALVDVNGDGRLDVVGHSSNNSDLFVTLNSSSAGTISFVPQERFTLSATSFGRVLAADFNKDGRIDYADDDSTTRVILAE